MLLAIDIGNSSIKVGIFTDGQGGPATARMDTHPLRSHSEYGRAFEGIMKEKGVSSAPLGVVVCSVVPGHTEAVRIGAGELCGCEPLVVGPGASGGLGLDIREPRELGPDRIASSVAASELFGAPVAVVDFGTATTVDFIESGNVLRGGTIMPGVGLMLDALSSGTARLPRVEAKRPEAVVGRDTEGSILSGVVYGTAGAVERIIEEAEGSMAPAKGPEPRAYRVAATGGFLEYLRPYLRRVDYVEPDLALKGLEIIYRRTMDA